MICGPAMQLDLPLFDRQNGPDVAAVAAPPSSHGVTAPTIDPSPTRTGSTSCALRVPAGTILRIRPDGSLRVTAGRDGGPSAKPAISSHGSVDGSNATPARAPGARCSRMAGRERGLAARGASRIVITPEADGVAIVYGDRRVSSAERR